MRRREVRSLATCRRSWSGGQQRQPTLSRRPRSSEPVVEIDRSRRSVCGNEAPFRLDAYKRRKRSCPPAARRCRTYPLPEPEVATPSPSRHRSSSSINASLSNPGRRLPHGRGQRQAVTVKVEVEVDVGDGLQVREALEARADIAQVEWRADRLLSHLHEQPVGISGRTARAGRRLDDAERPHVGYALARFQNEERQVQRGKRSSWIGRGLEPPRPVVRTATASLRIRGCAVSQHPGYGRRSLVDRSMSTTWLM